MKIIITIIYLSLAITAFSQNKITGKYSRTDSKIWLHDDSTFLFVYTVDLYKAWARGTWSLNGKKINFTIIPVYDTLPISNNSNQNKDSLVLSIDQEAERLVNINERPRTRSMYLMLQSEKLCPSKLILKKGRLYVLVNGKKQKRKINDGFTIKSFYPWYEKM